MLAGGVLARPVLAGGVLAGGTIAGLACGAVPSTKRARQRAGKAARMAELRRAQQRRRRLRVGGGGAALAAHFVGIAIVTTSGGGPAKSKGKVPAGLTARAAPAHSAGCAAKPAPSPSTTTVPASGNAVSIVPAPAGVGFPAPDGSSPRYSEFSAPPPFCIDVAKTYTATMVTDAGTISIKLYPHVAPLTVNSFVFLAGYHFFDGVDFHRVIPGFVDQGGDPLGTGSGGPGYKFADEVPASASAYVNGAVALANSGPNTNGSQLFLIVNGGGKQLKPLYSMFGQITSGLDVANAINADGSSSGTPTKLHKIVKVTISDS